jgi:hypothetical protein
MFTSFWAFSVHSYGRVARVVHGFVPRLLLKGVCVRARRPACACASCRSVFLFLLRAFVCGARVFCAQVLMALGATVTVVQAGVTSTLSVEEVYHAARADLPSIFIVNMTLPRLQGPAGTPSGPFAIDSFKARLLVCAHMCVSICVRGGAFTCVYLYV